MSQCGSPTTAAKFSKTSMLVFIIATTSGSSKSARKVSAEAAVDRVPRPSRISSNTVSRPALDV